MIRSLRAFFLSRELREKLMLIVLLGVAVAMWATAYASRAGRFMRQVNTTTATLKTQDSWLNRRVEIEAATKAATAQMDPAKTLDATALSVLVNQLANDSGVRPNASSPTTTSIGQFSMHKQQLVFNNLEWRAFTSFYLKLQERAPYVTITSLSLKGMGGNSALIGGSLEVASFEMRH
ncbi:hypothetical protein [Opitutus sp. ER46]|uniref:hypothetical protein n=1 Tax=Opitutus sp. ER46 TaxID=2161864 RepID=UPI000D2F9755|nr:hypothetical protein [Opitutus sp. ER46]PTX91645.1 hypothetical protein DB354_17400 [Opitutus sp. ER46]